MKISINPNLLRTNVAYFMQQAGYTYITDRSTGRSSFVRNFGRNNYPRFHVYIDETTTSITIDLHLDQKKPSYEGSHAHNAEYDGPQVEAELSRLQKLIT